MDRICYTCLEAKQVFKDNDTRQLICNDCFRKKHGKKKYYKPLDAEPNPTYKDLKNLFEKRF